jgi:predicted Zn-ribbon and HTH transcriptional regulator
MTDEELINNLIGCEGKVIIKAVKRIRELKQDCADMMELGNFSRCKNCGHLYNADDKCRQCSGE